MQGRGRVVEPVAAATVSAIRTKITDLGSKKLGSEYYYQSLPLCVIDAVFSLGIRYQACQFVVQAWCSAQTPQWAIARSSSAARFTIADFVRITATHEGFGLAHKFFGDRKFRTSPRGGILKADAAVRFGRALAAAGIDDFPDVHDPERVARASEAVRAIPGQRSGLSFDYFLMLAGEDGFVKADRMVRRFVAAAVGRPDVSQQTARDAVVAASRALMEEFPNLTPRLLDYCIWSYQREEDESGRRSRHGVARAGCRG